MAPFYAETEFTSDETDIAAFLDLALSRLGAPDRNAIILRYLRGLSVSAVGAELGLSTDAAQKRIGRALVKLRVLFVRNGITAVPEALESALGAQSASIAPPALLSAVLAHSLSSGASSTGAALIATMTIKAMSAAKATLLLAASMAAVVIVGTGTLIMTRTPISAATPPSATVTPEAPPTLPETPVAPQPSVNVTQSTPPSTAPSNPAMPLANVTFTIEAAIKGGNKDFPIALDPTVTRTGQPTLLLSSSTPKWGMGGAAFREVEFAPFLGKRMRFSAFVKSENLANWGGIQLWALGPGNKFMLHDDMGGRPITKTTDWEKYEIVADIPPEVQQIVVGLHLYGAGKIWMDSAQLEVVGPDVPITDDSIWHAWSFSSPHYSNALDPSTPRNGHPTLCLSSTVAKGGEWYAWDWNNRHPEDYRGKRVRMTGWIKTQNVTGPSGLNFRILDDHLRDIVPAIRKTVRGTNDWKQYELIADIPQEAGCICSGFHLTGKGKLWLDDVRYEVQN